MHRNQVFLSTIAQDFGPAAREFGLGLEIAQYCTASVMDNDFERTDRALRQQLVPGQEVTFHAPFNELFPCAIDPKARELAAQRYRQAIALAKTYGASKVVIHGGYQPQIYFPQWYVEQSIHFWRTFFQEEPGVPIVLENVLEPEPKLLLDIVQGVDHPDFRLCLDVGHVNAYSHYSAIAWLKAWNPWVSHFHIHNNDRSWDTHSGLDQGSIPMEEFLRQADCLCPRASYTLEVNQGRQAAVWMKEHGFL